MENNTKFNKLIFLIPLIVLTLFYTFHLIASRDNANPNSFRKILIAGRIETVYRMNKGFPEVSLNGKKITLHVPSGCSEYLMKGDSLFKDKNSRLIKTFRDLGDSIEVTEWGYSADGYPNRGDGFISNSYISKIKH